MQHEPIGSRVWVNTGCGEIAPGTVVGDHINTPGVRQITLDTGAVVHAVSAVQQSEGFLDLSVEMRQRVSNELHLGLKRDWNKLHHLKLALQETKHVRNLLRENNLDSSEAAQEVFKLLYVQQKRVDDAKARMEFEYAGDKMDVIVNTIPELSVNAAPVVQQSKGFTDLAEETKQEVFQRYDARRELLETQFQALCDDVYILELMKKLAQVDPDDYVMSESHCEKVFNTARQMARTFLHGIPRRLSKQDYIQELDYWIHEKTMQRDAFERELHEFAPWKVDLLRNVPVPSVCAPLVQQSEGFPDLDVDMREEIFKQYEALKEPLAEKVKSLNSDLMDLLGEKILLKRLHEKELWNAQIQRRVPDTSKKLEIWDLDCLIKRKTAARDAAKKELDTIVPWKLDVLKKVPPPSVCAPLVQQSEGFPDLDPDIREEVFKVYESWKEPLEDELYDIEFNLKFLRTRKKFFMSAPPHKTTWGPEVFKRSHEMLLPMRGPPRSMHIDDLIAEMNYQINEQTVKRDAVMKKLEDIAPWKIDLLKKAPQRAVVKQSQAFTDLDDDSKEEVFKRLEAGREPLEEKFKHLKDDVQFLTDWLAETDEETKNGTLHQSVKYDRFIKPALEEIIRESNIGGAFDFRDAIKDKIKHKLDQKTAELKAIKRELNKNAPWKSDLLKRKK